MRQRAQEPFRIGGAGGLPDLFVSGIPLAIAQVVAGVGAEQHAHLRHQREAGADIGRIGAGQRHPVHADSAALRIVEPLDQLEDRALARARRPDDGDGLARLDFKREIPQRRSLGARGIAEGYIAEAEAAARRFGQAFGAGRGRDFGLGFEQFSEPARRTRAAQQIAIDFGERAERTGHKAAGDDESGDRAAGNLARRHRQRAAPHHQHDPAEYQQNHHRRHAGAQQDAATGGVEGAFDHACKPLALALFLAEALHDLHRREHLGDIGADIGDAILAGARDGADLAPEIDDRRDHQRNADQQP